MTRCLWILALAGPLFAEGASPFDKVGETVIYESKEGAFVLPPPAHDRFGEPLGPMPPPVVLAAGPGLAHTAAILYMLDDKKRPSRLIVDGKEVEAGEGTPCGVSFPPSGGRMIWIECMAPERQGMPDVDHFDEMMGKQRVVADGKPETWYVEVEGLCWSDDGAHYAYVGTVSSLVSGKPKVDIVVDGKTTASQEYVMGLRFIPGSTGVVYIAREARESFVVWDGKAEERYEVVEDRSLVIRPDGRRHAYIGRNGQKTSIVVDGERLKGYVPWSSTGTCLDLEPNGDRIAFLQAEQPRLVVLAGGNATKYTAETLFGFRADGRVVYVGKNAKGGDAVCVDDEAEEPVGYIDPRVFWSADRKAFAYQGNRGSERTLSFGGKQVQPGGWVWPLSFSPDGTKIAYVASGDKAGERKLVIGDQVHELPNYYVETLVWTPDGNHVVGVSHAGVWIDAKAGPACEAAGGVRFSADGKRVGYLAARGKTLVLVVAEP